jgi:hypothetical protein
MLISAYADFWSELPYRVEGEKRGTSSKDVNIEKKSFLVALLIIRYDALSIPAYWLRDTSLAAFKALMALYVVYAVVTYILVLVFNMFIPHCMRTAGGKRSQVPSRLSMRKPRRRRLPRPTRSWMEQRHQHVENTALRCQYGALSARLLEEF